MNDLHELVRITGYTIEYFGVLVIVMGSIVATVRFLFGIGRNGSESAYHDFRGIFGRAIILGLDFLIAGDIIRTVVVSHTLTRPRVWRVSVYWASSLSSAPF